MAPPRRKRVAILGGGLAGLTAAYELADRDKNLDITIYQIGWRLGGKVASSRNATQGMRIEEHGIHVLFGAYENVFHILRRAYGELGLPWKHAFRERSEFTLMERVRGAWIPWNVGLPRSAGDPGDCLAKHEGCCKETPQLTSDLLAWLRDRVVNHFAGTRLERPATWFFGGCLGRACRSAEAMCAPGAREAERAYCTRRLLRRLQLNLFLLRLVGLIGHSVWSVLRPVFGDALIRIDALRRLWILAELGIAAAAGLTQAARAGHDVHALDASDLTDWLGRHGVFGCRISRTTANSAALRMVYEVVFAYENGDPTRPRLAAGTALRDLLRLLFDRRGAIAYTMRAGSAETMVTPLYRVLAQRPNVHFEFFHRIDGLQLSDDERHIERINFTRQATPATGTYAPLLDGGAWPDRPKYELLVDGEALRQSEHDGHDLESPAFTPPTARTGVLHRRGPTGGDFDAVVLAIPVGALPDICGPLIAARQDWHAMVSNVQTTATQAVQLWFDRTTDALGWHDAETEEPTMLGGYAQPFGNWVDLSITLAAEHWEGTGVPEPHSVAYLAGPLPDADIPTSTLASRAAQNDAVRLRCARWLANHGRRLWPDAFADNLFDHGRLVAAPVPGGDRYSSQLFRANTRPSERYTLTLPGTTRFRLASDGAGFEELYLAGDWTANGFDVGSAEAAVMSGRLAARALLGLNAQTMPVYGEHHDTGADVLPGERPEDISRRNPATTASGGYT